MKLNFKNAFIIIGELTATQKKHNQEKAKCVHIINRNYSDFTVMIRWYINLVIEGKEKSIYAHSKKLIIA